jgi:hypothetical protein
MVAAVVLAGRPAAAADKVELTRDSQTALKWLCKQVAGAQALGSLPCFRTSQKVEVEGSSPQIVDRDTFLAGTGNTRTRSAPG